MKHTSIYRYFKWTRLVDKVLCTVRSSPVHPPNKRFQRARSRFAIDWIGSGAPLKRNTLDRLKGVG